MSENFIICHQCESKTTYQDRVHFRAECENCHEDLHVCKNCTFYDENSHNECREPSAEKVQDKNRRNVCEYFKPSIRNTQKKNDQTELLKAAEALFKKKS